MAMPVIARHDWTVEMLDALPDDGQRHEIVDGELFVTPSPAYAHQFVLSELHARIHGYLRGSTVGRVLFPPSDIRRNDRSRNRVQPDLYVVRLDGKALPVEPFGIADLLLAVEVASPGNLRYDYHTKRTLYLEGGVPEYWVVNPEARNISRWRTEADPGEMLSREIAWQPAGMATSLLIDVEELFREALD
ncbi:MAG: Uma2 family endonuclease [Gemmatimonadota bacterium]|nr:Uma2 family endonuclease [Gemmatimonadota bacterium]